MFTGSVGETRRCILVGSMVDGHLILTPRMFSCSQPDTEDERWNGPIFAQGCPPLALDGDSAGWTIGHVGDSRGYAFRDGTLQRITRDHTVVQDLVESGAIPPSSTADHPLSHLINRAVGTAGTVHVDISQGDALPGNIFLLCTDGSSELLTDDELEAALQGLAITGLDEKSAELVVIAHEGAPDNVTLGFLAVEDLA